MVALRRRAGAKGNPDSCGQPELPCVSAAEVEGEQRIGTQAALTQRGYDTQGINEVIGSKTRAALRRWQIANGRVADGYLTAAIADELMSAR